jgi:mitochondrial ornithine carrier protein
VRLQSQPDTLPLRYTGPLDCFRQSLRADGFLGLYRGISAPLVGAALETSSLFFWERVGRELLFSSSLYSRQQPLPLSALWLTGAISGAFTSLVLTPIELVKCKIQVPASSPGVVQIAPRPLAVIREVWRHQGLRGFWHGQLGTLIRETGGCAAWFGSKETVTLLFRKWNASSSQKQNLNPNPQNLPTTSSAIDLAPLPLWQQALAGATAGMSYNFLFFPADTIKSRMQTESLPPNSSQVQKQVQKRFWEEGRAIWRAYGVRGLYRGCGITVLRSGPSSALIFVVFDALKGGLHLS